MTTYTISSGHDTATNSLAPTTAFGTATTVVFGGVNGAYVYFPLPADLAGQTIASATLTGHAFAVSAATLSTYLVTSTWADATLTFNRQPSHGATHVDTVVAATAVDNPVNLDAGTLVQAVSSGQAWFGFYITATAITSLRSFDSGFPSWTLTIVTSEAPDTPQSLVPNGTVVAQAKPMLTCDFTDNGGLSSDMGAIQVQIDPASNFVSPAFDSGSVASIIPLLNLASTAYAGLASGSTTYWRVRVQDTSGLWSGWSDPATFTYRPQPTITLLTPAAGVLWDPTSSIIASTSANLSAYRVQITEGTDSTAIRYDSGRLPANPAALTTVAVSLPEKYDNTRVLVDDRTYQLHIRVWDTFTGRQATPGSPAYVESWTTFHFDDDLTQTPITTLQADQLDSSPAVTLTWTRAAAPDAWIVLRDSTVVARLNPADVITGVSTYSWTDTYPQPWVSHTYDVRPLTSVSGTMKRAPAGPTAAIIPESLGVWLFTRDGQRLALDDTDTTQLSVNDRRAIYKPLNVRYDVDIITGFEGVSGQLTGVAPSGLDDTIDLAAAKATLASIKANPSSPVHMVYGSFSGDVLLRNLGWLPDPRSNATVPLLRVSFGVNQVGDFEGV